MELGWALMLSFRIRWRKRRGAQEGEPVGPGIAVFKATYNTEHKNKGKQASWRQCNQSEDQRSFQHVSEKVEVKRDTQFL